MSTEENPKEESETTQKLQETDSKQLKDRKSRKEKVKPLAKVYCNAQTVWFLPNDTIITQDKLLILGGYSSSSAHND